MPVRPSGSKGGHTCYKWGTAGKRYCGSGAKAKAARQGVAISLSKARAKGHKVPPPPR